MSYESDCNDYAVFGNPFQEAMDYEENAVYDQFDGRDEYDYCGDFDPGCPDCGYKSDCPACKLAIAEIEFRRESSDCEESEVPF